MPTPSLHAMCHEEKQSVLLDSCNIHCIRVNRLQWQLKRHRFLRQTCLYIAGASAVSSEIFFRFTVLSCYTAIFNCKINVTILSASKVDSTHNFSFFDPSFSYLKLTYDN